MKISITHYGNTTSYETERDDQHISEMASVLKGLMVSVGFHPSSVDDYFVGSEGEWFPELDEISMEEESNLSKAKMDTLIDDVEEAFPTNDNRDDYYYKCSKGKVINDPDGITQHLIED
jgi:hypothetical protein